MSPSTFSLGPVESLVDACRTRIASQVRRRECFLAVAIALIGLCGLLFLGTRYVPLATLPLAVAFGAWLALARWKTGIPSGYAVARRVDDGQGMGDQFSTAYYFRSAEPERSSEGVTAAQYERAAASAADIRPEAVIPRTLLPTQRATVYLLASAVLLFGLRASVQSKLSLEPPLASLIFASLFGAEHDARPRSRPLSARIDQPPAAEAIEAYEDLAQEPASDAAPHDQGLPEEEYEEPPFDPDELPEVEGLITVPLDEQLAEEMQDSSLAEPSESGTEEGEDADLPTDQSDAWDEEAQSLLDKLKQAFENMLETLDMASADSSDSEEGKEQGSGSTEEASSSGEPTDSEMPEDGMSPDAADASMEGGEPGQESGETASAGNTGGEDSQGDQSSSENASAAGSSDGDKEFAEAEQLEVLGALEELYMERAEKMKGDVTIETRLAEQSASVPYNERSTLHADQGGAISRDAIPAAYRTYIQNYFETLVRTAE